MKVISNILIGCFVCLLTVVVSPLIIILGSLILMLLVLFIELFWVLVVLWFVGYMVNDEIRNKRGR